MKRRLLTALCAVAISTGIARGQDSPLRSLLKPELATDGGVGHEELSSRGYLPLFNGKDLAGWRNPYPHGQASVVDGEIHLLGNEKFFLVTEQAYADFHLIVEIHLPEGQANSGVMFRCHVDELAKQKKVYGYQAECDGSDRRWSGGLFDEGRRRWIWPSTKGRSLAQFLSHEEESKTAFSDAKIADSLDRDGWNRFEIICIEDRIQIAVNGVTTVSFRDTTDASGYIGIQHHGEDGQVYRFRNLFIKELPDVPAEDSVSLIDQTPVSVTKIDDNTTLVDFGKVAFGNIAMRIPPEGSGLGTVHFGEKLKNGRIDRQPPGTVRYGASQFRKGSGEVGTWIVPAPVDQRNTEQAGAARAHPPAVLTPKNWLPVMPFRWIEVEGWEGEFEPDSIIRRAAFATDWSDDASSFECSDDSLNRIWDLCKYSIKATTFAGVYVDGDRERIPYEADAYLNQLSHYCTDDNVKMAATSFDWLIENGTWPTEWAPHMVFMAHAEWKYSGNSDWIKQRYQLLKSKTLLNRTDAYGLVRSGDMDRRRNDIVDWPKQERDGFVFTEINTVVNAFHIEALKQMAEMARAIGKNEEAEAFANRAALANSAFQKLLFNEEAGIYRDGVGTDHSSIHANFFPLAFDLVPAERVPSVLGWLEQKEMSCSVYAAQYFLEGLFRHGSGEKALGLILADGDRSWKHMVNSGTTISWEAWDLKYKPNQDWNHAWGAAPANLLPRFVLGVQPATAGWQTALIRPHVGGLTHAQGKVPTPRGTIGVDWKNDSNFKLSLTLPEGVTAQLDLPAADGTTGVFINGDAAAAKKNGGRWIVAETVSGSVTLEVK